MADSPWHCDAGCGTPAARVYGTGRAKLCDRHARMRGWDPAREGAHLSVTTELRQRSTGQQLGLFGGRTSLDDAAHVAHSDTSRAAARSLPLEWLQFRCLRTFEQAAQTHGGLTADDLLRAQPAWGHATASGRVSELASERKKLFCLELAGEQRKTRRGRKAEVYRLTDRGHEYLAKYRAQDTRADERADHEECVERRRRWEDDDWNWWSAGVGRRVR